MKLNPMKYVYQRFFVVKRDLQNDPYHFLRGEGYTEFDQQMKQFVDRQVSKSCESVTVTSYDGLTLHGRFYQRDPQNPLFILFHGYRTHPFRDNAGLIAYCEEHQCSYILCDQRGQGESEGECVTLGNKERFDVKSWCEYAVNRFGANYKLVLGGTSMGGTSVVLASELDLPKNVQAIIDDCGFSSANEIMVLVAKRMGFPEPVSHSILKTVAQNYAGFNLDEVNTKTAMTHCKIPTMFIHGKEDRFVPISMSEKAFEAAKQLGALEKRFVEIPNAAHMMSYFNAPKQYLTEVQEFLEELPMDED